MKLFTFLPSFSLWRYLGLGLVAVGIAACGGSDDAVSSNQDVTLTAQLSGKQESTPTTTSAQGTGTLTLVTSTRALSGQIKFTGMTATAAHIHAGDVGLNGGVIVALTESTPGTWVVPNNTVLTEAQATALKAGGYYFNVHSTAFPAGEIRGQIGREVYTAGLTAAQEVPANNSTATGSGFVSLDPASKSISVRLNLSGMSATAAHIHTGAAGANGSVLVGLSKLVSTDDTVWVSAANTTMTDAQIATMKSAGLYFNAHSVAVGSGEIRGQITKN